MKRSFIVVAASLAIAWVGRSQAADAVAWSVGTPVVSYWAGPGFPGGSDLNDASATQLAEGGWNLVWCRENSELDAAQRHGLRGLLTHPLLAPAALDDPKQRAELDAFVERVKKHPALYAYHLTDEPDAGRFPALAKLVAYLRERDPAHLAYINLLPTYANNEQLGIKGEKVPAYVEHLRKYVETVHPSLLSYDHYQFTNAGDNPDYFLNLALMRDQAVAAKLPFLNIVQASCWVPGSAASPQAPRVPNGDEMAYLVYTTLAYGAQGISYYVYCYPNHEGGIARADGTTTPLYAALKTLNREFVGIAKELQPLKPLGVFHAGMQVPGGVSLPKDAAFAFDPPVPPMDYKPGERVRGALIGLFGSSAQATHALVVNLDYKNEVAVGLKGPAPLEVFDARAGRWSPASGARAELNLPKGGGKLLRVRP